MTASGNSNHRRIANARALAAFGAAPALAGSELYRVVREGGPICVFTIGYERRDGDDLFSALRDAGVEHLADIRDKPMSRKPDFRAGALRAACDNAGIEYGAWTELGSTEQQRDHLRESGDFVRFKKTFRSYANRSMCEPLDRLAKTASKKVVALLCYERSHEECHRSIVADMLADRLNAEITAIL